MKNRLRELRAQRRWSQADLAERVGVSRQAVNAVEIDKHDPSLGFAYRIASAFELPVETIFENPNGAHRTSGGSNEGDDATSFV